MIVCTRRRDRSAPYGEHPRSPPPEEAVRALMLGLTLVVFVVVGTIVLGVGLLVGPVVDRLIPGLLR